MDLGYADSAQRMLCDPKSTVFSLVNTTQSYLYSGFMATLYATCLPVTMKFRRYSIIDGILHGFIENQTRGPRYIDDVS